MLKKITSLLLSLLLCLTMLPGQALAADESAPVDPPAVVEPADPEGPGIMPMAEVVEGNDRGTNGLD